MKRHHLLLSLLAPAFGFAQSSFVLPMEDEAIGYNAPTRNDPVARLQRKLERGDVTLEYQSPGGYLLSVLRNLDVPVSSQVLVFSKTSFQLQLISPAAPRALYFNDNVYIGWVKGSQVMEVSSVDPERGAFFYTLDNRDGSTIGFVRRDECLQCHASPRTLGVPGHIVRSVYPDVEGFPQLQAGSFDTDDNSPISQRWGGWFVSGTHGAQRHMGNVWVKDRNQPERLDREAGANLTDLAKVVDLSSYASPHSDPVALMVLAHQSKLHNLITRVGYETKLALSHQQAISQALKRPPEEWFDSTRRRIFGPVDALLKYLLFSGEAPLTAPVRGTSDFQKQFAGLGPRDSKGRSLRDFDLDTRLFRYRCSFLIYSRALDSLPQPALDYLYRRLYQILTGEQKEFDLLSASDRKAILEILVETKPSLPAYFRR